MKNESTTSASITPASIKTEEQIKAIVLSGVDSILSQQPSPSKKWGQKEHIHLLACLILLEDFQGIANRRELKNLLTFQGLGGNASQFRQYLSKPDGGNRLQAGATLDDYK